MTPTEATAPGGNYVARYESFTLAGGATVHMVSDPEIDTMWIQSSVAAPVYP